MKKIILILVLIVFISSVSAQELCEYNGIKTKFDYPYQAPGEKIEYKDEKFVSMVDSKVVKNLEQLKGLICLEFADFYNQGISGDLETLKDLTNLKVLNLHTNPGVSGDVCTLSKATKLKSLKFAFDEKVYGDISCLKDLNLDTFAMTYTKISGDLSDISHMTNLKALYLSGTDIAGDISALSKLINLEELTISDPEFKDSKIHGDLTSLDNLKKLRRVALYNMDVTNCKHFHETHPSIEEGGCSVESAATLKNTNLESEKIIGKGGVPQGPDEGPKPNGDRPPEECMVNGEFIGEDKCRALVDKTSSGGSPTEDKPPEACIVNGEFIGEDGCRKMMEKFRPPSEKNEVQKMVTSKGFFKRIISWFIGLFK